MHGEPPSLLEIPLDAQTTLPRPALSLRGLTKVYGSVRAVDDLSLDVPVGSFFGVVGPNGAGKTTTLSMATGLLRPDAGSAAVLGRPLWDDDAASLSAGKALLGVLPDGLRLYDRLTGAELVRYAGLLHGLPRPVALARAEELLDVLDLAGASRKLVVDYSAGMTKKVALACALVHAPRVLVLDEPFEAVDPVSATGIREILQSFVAGGGTVVLSSHVMDLVERICDQVAVVAGGRVLAAGSVAAVRGDGTLEDAFVALVRGTRPEPAGPAGAPPSAGAADEGASGRSLAWLRGGA